MDSSNSPQAVQVEELVASPESECPDLKFVVVTPNDPIIGQLPVEIASYVFQTFVEMETPVRQYAAFPHSRMTNAPFRLGAVCRTWRAIAWSSPQLWTNLSIKINTRGNDTLIDLTEQWLERSGTSPLSIQLYEADRFDWEDVNYLEFSYFSALMGVVNAESYRWQNLDLQLSVSFLADFCLRFPTLEPATLCELTVSFISSFSAKEFLNRLTLPSLRKITLIKRVGNIVINSLISLITRSTCHLTLLRLNMNAFRGPEIFRLLQTTPSLMILDISFRDDTGLNDFLRNVMKYDNSRSSTFLPNLEVIRTSLDHRHRFSWEAILDGLKSNLGGQGLSRMHPLRSIKLDFRLQVNTLTFLTKYTLQRFTDLGALGLNISVDYYGEDVIAKLLALHFPPEENL